jgi:hypothetical protein
LVVAQARADIAERQVEELKARASREADRRRDLRRRAAIREFRVVRAVILVAAAGLFLAALLAPTDIADSTTRDLVRVALLAVGILGASTSIGDLSVWKITGWLQEAYVRRRVGRLRRLFDGVDEDTA